MLYKSKRKQMCRNLLMGGIMCLAGFTTFSCSDTYDLDTVQPSGLNTIYGYMKDKGNFKNFLHLIDDLGYSEVLAKTGSKTLFAADDDAFAQFYSNNEWGVSSYEQLSLAQKKLLLNSAMIDNPYPTSMLSTAEGPVKGEVCRRMSSQSIFDSVQVISTYSEELPQNERWTVLRSTHPEIVLFKDASGSQPMIHFTPKFLSANEVPSTDVDFLYNDPDGTRQSDDTYVNRAKIIETENCKNGFIHIVDRVIVPMDNMAEIIRTNGKTKIFSHMLDRFSFPYPNAAVTRDYKNLHPDFTGTIYTKKYFALRGAGGRSQKVGPDGKTFQDEKGEINLQYDPGWNQFFNEFDTRADMAAMFVPNDESMFEYFSEGGAGWQLIQTYAPDPYAEVPEGDFDALYKKIDMIPLSTLADLLNVIMFSSFNGSVPSKMTTLRDFQSQEEMFTPDDINAIDTCLLACNGAVYVMDKVYGPASYISVAAPANISTTNLIMKWAINNGSDASADKMHMNYFAYLMAMRSRFAFFLPSDEALKRYYDPVSFTSTKPRVIQMSYRGSNTALPLTVGRILYRYDLENGVIGSIYNLDQLTENELLNRLKDILESHTIVLDGNNPIDNEDEYYIAKNHSALKVTKDENNEIIKVQGGFQLENERAGIVSGDPGTHEIEVKPTNINHMANGNTYVIEDSPIIPASKSIYGIIHNEFGEQCSAFYDLTDMNSNEDIIKACGLEIDKLAVWLDAKSSGGVDYNVKFFNNYDYTVLVPTNEAIADAEAHGFPTWASIRADYESLPEDPEDPEVHILNGQDSLRLQTKITYLNNFIRCHFIDGSLFEDKSDKAENEYVTQSYDTENGVFVKVIMSRNGQQLRVHDNYGGANYSTEGDMRNIMARDITCLLDPNGNYSGAKTSPTGRSSMNNIVLQSSSFAVIHQINGVLNHTKLVDGRHDSTWATPATCKRYLKYHSNHPIKEHPYE